MLFHIGLLEDALFAMQKSYAVKRTVAEITLVRLCEPKLDTSEESILARLSRIEEQMVAGVPAAPAPVMEQTAVSTPAPVSQPVEREAPAAPAAPPAPTPKPTPVAPPAPATPAQRVLRPLRTWPEAVERVRATSAMAASFLVTAKAYTAEDGRVVVKLPSEFVRSMISREGAPEALRAALSVCLARKLDAAEILYEVEDAPKETDSLLDLILEASEE